MKRNPLKTRNVKKKDKNNPRKIFMTTSKINIQTTSNNEYQSSKCLMNKVNHASTSMTTTLTTTSTKTKTTIMKDIVFATRSWQLTFKQSIHKYYSNDDVRLSLQIEFGYSIPCQFSKYCIWRRNITGQERFLTWIENIVHVWIAQYEYR